MPEKQDNVYFDLGINRKGQLNEFVLTAFGGVVKGILGAMFNNSSFPVSIKGNKREVDSFTNAISKEKSHLEKIQRYGLNDPRTYKSKFKLEKAIKDFEKSTGISWPFRG